MTEILAGVAIVLSLTAGAAVLVLAHELGQLRAHRLRSEAHAQTPLASLDTIAYQALSGASAMLPAHQARLVLFTRAACDPCERLLGDLSNDTTKVHDMLVLVARASETETAAMAAAARVPPDRAVADPLGTMAAHFRVQGYPSAVLVTPQRGLMPASPVLSFTDLVSLGGSQVDVRSEQPRTLRVEPNADSQSGARP